jgi:hypothetical protein
MKRSVFIVIRTEGEYESRDHPVMAFDSEPMAKAYANECAATFKRQHELFVANRERHGENWWSYDIKQTDAIEARYERKLLDRRCSIRNSDVWWGVWEVPAAGATL